MMSEKEDARQIRGLAIVSMGSQIKRMNASSYYVRSQNGNGWYHVFKNGLEWRCGCPDHNHRNVVCKHIYAVEFSQTLRQKITSENLGIEEIDEIETICKKCGSSKVIKQGIRKNRTGNSQRFKCKDCGFKFVVNESGFHKMKNQPKIVTLALDLYFKGMSYRRVVDHLKQFYGITVSHVAIIKWIRKYTQLMKGYVDSLMRETSGIWHTDEMAVNIKGEYNWLWNVMDHETRFLLASQISQKREVADARNAFQKAKKVANGKPEIMITDGLKAYIEAFKKEFFTLKNPRTQHIANAGARSRTTNNMVERLQGTIRERNKVLRALKNQNENSVVDGFKIYYNFIRPHQALNGLTPAQVANLNLSLDQNKWLSLIKRSVQDREILRIAPNNESMKMQG
jgi:putative transposase